MKRLSIIFIFFFFVSRLPFDVSRIYAQQPTQEWVARYTGPYNDLYGPFLQVDKAGNSYIAGTHVIGQYPNDSTCILCVKYNSSGVQLWATLYRYPGYGYFVPTGLAIDSSGNAYVISGIALTSVAPRNMLIVKFNNLSGSPVWTKTYFGQYSQSSFFDIKIDRLNNIYVVGSSDSSHLIIRYNTNGDSVWVRKYHPSWLTAEYVRNCTIDDSLNIIFTGQRRFYYPPYGWYDSLLVAKYSSTGVLRWESVYAYNVLGSDIGTKIIADQIGNSFIGGITTVSGNSVYFTLKYDRNGSRQWARIYYPPGSTQNDIYGIALDRINNALYVSGGAIESGIGMATTIKYNVVTGDSLWVKRDTGSYNRGRARDIKLDTSGNIYITGETYNFPSYAPYDIMTTKYSSTGSKLWIMIYNWQYNGLDIGKAIAIDGQNNIYVLGTSQAGYQMFDYVVIKYNQTVGIKQLSNELPLSYRLEQNYPNPFNPGTKFRIQIPKFSSVNITIFDVLGRAVENPVNEILKPGVYEIDINGLNYASGTYFYRMTADGNIIDTKKFVLIK